MNHHAHLHINRMLGLPSTFRLVCLRKSKQAHVLYKRAAPFFHGCYFGAGFMFEHGILSALSGALLLILILGWAIEENVA